MIITQKLLNRVNGICIKIAQKTGVNSDDLMSECLSKIPNIINNYDARTGKDFETYLLFSCRGYCLNYCRDKSFLSGVGRTNLLIYQTSKKFPNLAIAAECMQIELVKLEEIHYMIKQLRRYNSVDITDEWKIGENNYYTDSFSRVEVLNKLVSQDDIMYAYNCLVLGKPVDDSDRLFKILDTILINKDEFTEV